MAMIPALDSAVSGIQSNLARLDRAAGRIASPANMLDLAGDVVDQKLAKHGVKANVRVLQTADKMIGTLIDLLA